MLGLIIFAVAMLLGCGFWTSLFLALLPIMLPWILMASKIVTNDHNRKVLVEGINQMNKEISNGR